MSNSINKMKKPNKPTGMTLTRVINVNGLELKDLRCKILADNGYPDTAMLRDNQCSYRYDRCTHSEYRREYAEYEEKLAEYEKWYKDSNRELRYEISQLKGRINSDKQLVESYTKKITTFTDKKNIAWFRMCKNDLKLNKLKEELKERQENG